MKRLQVGFLVVVVAGISLALLTLRDSAPPGNPVVINETAVPPVPTLDPDRVAQGERLYVENCAVCHGASLEGAPDWKQPLADGSLPPPPHDSSGHTWHHPDALLLNIIADGGDPAYNSKMPAFKNRLSDNQRVAIMEFIKSRWGRDEREFQWWITFVSSQ